MYRYISHGKPGEMGGNMKKGRRIAILTTSFGAGHFKAAQAIEQALKQNNTAVQTRMIDSFATAAPRLTRVVIGLYLNMLARVPSLYGMLYKWGNRTKTALLGRNFMSVRLAVSTDNQMAEFPAQSIICTHASPTGAICQLKKQGKLKAPVIAAITDFVVHRFWIYDEVDLYTVMHEQTAQDLLAAGVSPDKIQVVGIPIAAKFSVVLPKVEMQRKLGLATNIPVVLIMGGGTGALPMDNIVAEFNRCKIPLQLLVVAGHNEPLRRRLKKLTSVNVLHVFGFVDNIHELMSAADLLVTKPGGLSAAEALAMGLPMILLRPIPGQEEGNAKFLTEAGVACCIRELSKLVSTTENLLQNPVQRNMMRCKAQALAKPHAAQAVATFALGLAKKSR